MPSCLATIPELQHIRLLLFRHSQRNSTSRHPRTRNGHAALRLFHSTRLSSQNAEKQATTKVPVTLKTQHRETSSCMKMYGSEKMDAQTSKWCVEARAPDLDRSVSYSTLLTTHHSSPLTMLIQEDGLHGLPLKAASTQMWCKVHITYT